jgi:heme oxygenase
MDLARLKLETEADHQLTEDSIPLMDGDLVPSVYVSLLARLYGFIRGWELWTDSVDLPRFQALLQARRRSPLLIADLDHFSAKIPDFVYAGPTLDRAALPAVLGAMYVVEGSTLGGQLIAKHVERVLQLQEGRGSAYFRGYKDSTGSMWTELKNVLVEVSDEDADLLIHAAKVVFKDFREWMRVNQE